MTDKKIRPKADFLSARQPVPRIHARRHEEILEAVAYANVPAANVHAADAALLVANVQGNVFDWVELQTCTVGEAVVAVATFVTASLGVVDVFAVANTDHTVDARPVVEAVSWTCGDRIVLRFLVETAFRTIFFQVGEGADHTQWVVVELVTVFQVETVGLVSNALEITLRIASGYGALTSECGTCANC